MTIGPMNPEIQRLVSEDLKTADMVIGLIYVLCFCFGVPSNILTLMYFLSKKKDIPTLLYTYTSLTDLVITFIVILVGISFLTSRSGGLLDNEIICTIHGVLFQVGQRFSVFLVSVLSISRTITLMMPLRRLNKRVVMVTVLGFLVALVVYFVTPLILGIQVWAYHLEGVYCWADPIKGYELFDTVDNILDCVALSVPVIPITMSCAISTLHVYRSQGVTPNSRSSNSRKQKATITIILFTGLYIIFNIPLFINFVIYTITILKYSYPGPFYRSNFMFYYSWNMTMILSTTLNSTLNPVIYMTRINSFRVWLKRGIFTMLSKDGMPITAANTCQSEYDDGTKDTAIILRKIQGHGTTVVLSEDFHNKQIVDSVNI